jgi:hypothetical protein
MLEYDEISTKDPRIRGNDRADDDGSHDAYPHPMHLRDARWYATAANPVRLLGAGQFLDPTDTEAEVTAHGTQEASTMDGWEYTVRKLDFEAAEDASVYNRMGAEGWELVSTHSARHHGVFKNPDVLSHVVAIFKRPTSREHGLGVPGDE